MSPIKDHNAGLKASMRIVVLHGTEPWLARHRTRQFEEVLRSEFGAVSKFAFDGDQAQLSDVLDEVRSYAMFDPHKLVIVDNAHKFVIGDSRRRALEAYAKQPTPEASLLLRAESWHRGKLDALVKKVGALIKCSPLSEREAVGWCIRTCEENGCKLQPQAANLLVERLGPGLDRLESELGKLASYVGDSNEITRDDVLTLVGHSREEKAWALQSAIMTGKPARACAKLHELLDVSQVDETLAMWAITDMLRRMHTASQLLQQGEPEGSFKRALRMDWPPGDRMLDLARRAKPRRFAQLLRQAVRTDVNGKTGLGARDRNVEALTMLLTDTIGCL